MASRCVRGYQTLSISVNGSKGVAQGLKTTIDSHAKSHVRKHLHVLRDFIDDYKLDDKTLMCSLYPHRNHQLTLNGLHSSVNVQSLESLGSLLFALERTKAAMDLGSTLGNDNVDILSSATFQRLQRPSTLNTFLRQKGFLFSTNMTDTKTAQSSFFILLGLVANSYGKPQAAHLLKEKVFKGRKSMLEIAARA